MIVYFAIGAICLAFLTAVAAAVAVRRARAATDERVAEAVQTLAAGMQETMRDLAGALEAGSRVPRTDRFVVELAATLDLDQVAGRTLEAAATIPGVEAAFLDAGGPDGARLAASLGIPEDEAAKTAVSIPDNDNLRAVEVSYRYRLDAADESSTLIRSGVVLPLRADGEPVGTLSAFTRSPVRQISDGEIDELESVAFKAGAALENARRYAEARALADLDALTRLHNRRYFHETLAREVARALRYERRLAVIVFDLDDFKAINDRIGHLAGDSVLAEAAERLLTAARTADIACRVGGDEFAVIVPEGGVEDGEELAGRIAQAIAARPIGNAGVLQLSAGVAELRASDQPDDLFKRADDALYRAKELGKARTVAVDGV
ncbi:MAG: diguanylate cyclase [Gaiellaceae bacterium]